MQQIVELWRRQPALLVGACIAALVVLRLLVVILTPMEIGPDEAQYWRWGQTLDWGYYSKPPLIAWVIALPTAIFGDSEWAIRAPSAILHGLAGFFLFVLGRKAFNASIGAWAAVIYLMMPGVWLSSVIMSTDAVLLPCWAAALLCLWRFREKATWTNALLAGAAIGLGMLAKYAALYLFVGAALTALIDRDSRRALLSLPGLVLLAAALAVLSPNLIWNASHGFETVSHTADNANLDHVDFNVLRIGEFITDQMAVFGPLLVIALFVGGAMLVRRKTGETFTREAWLLCFIIPPLAVIVVQSMMSRAHANWAATAYPAASVLVASWAARPRWGALIKVGVALNALVGLVFVAAAVAPAIGDAAGASGAFKRVRGWEQLAQDLAVVARDQKATALLFEEREVWHDIDYYGRNLGLPPVRAWQKAAVPRSHAEQAGKLLPGEDGNVLVAMEPDGYRIRIENDFEHFEPIGTLSIPLGGDNYRIVRLYLARGYNPPARTPEYEAEIRKLEIADDLEREKSAREDLEKARAASPAAN